MGAAALSRGGLSNAGCGFQKIYEKAEIQIGFLAFLYKTYILNISKIP